MRTIPQIRPIRVVTGLPTLKKGILKIKWTRRVSRAINTIKTNQRQNKLNYTGARRSPQHAMRGQINTKNKIGNQNHRSRGYTRPSYLEYLYIAKVFRVGFSPTRQPNRVLHLDCKRRHEYPVLPMHHHHSKRSKCHRSKTKGNGRFKRKRTKNRQVARHNTQHKHTTHKNTTKLLLCQPAGLVEGCGDRGGGVRGLLAFVVSKISFLKTIVMFAVAQRTQSYLSPVSCVVQHRPLSRDAVDNLTRYETPLMPRSAALYSKSVQQCCFHHIKLHNRITVYPKSRYDNQKGQNANRRK